jgi:hypothetical protein
MSLWTTKLVRHFISTRFGIESCRERVRQVLHALGFRLRRLRHRHLRAEPEEQEAFMTELEARLEEWPGNWEMEAIRHFFRYLAGVKAQVRRLCGLKTPESLVA